MALSNFSLRVQGYFVIITIINTNLILRSHLSAGGGDEVAQTARLHVIVALLTIIVIGVVALTLVPAY